jgi:hypothetical protein
MGTQKIEGAKRKLVALWALGGVTLLLVQALVRLTPIAWEPVASSALTPLLWVVYVAWTLVNAYFEGYRGFHLAFVPRVVGRTERLLDEPTLLRVLLAPLYVIGYFDATKSEKVRAWGVTILVWIAIFIVRKFPQPARGIVDAGVVCGLFFGTLSLLVQGAPVLFGRVSAKPGATGAVG